MDSYLIALRNCKSITAIIEKDDVIAVMFVGMNRMQQRFVILIYLFV